MPTPPTVVRLLPTRGLKARLAINHAWAAVALILTGAATLAGGDPHHGHGGWHLVVAVLAILAGVAVLVAIARELATYDARHHAAVGWAEVFAGIMLVVEGLEHLKFTKFVQPALGYFVAGGLTLYIGLNLARFTGLRVLRLDDEGLFARITPLRWLRAAWSDVALLSTDARGMTIERVRGGRRRLDFGAVANRDEALAMLRLHAARNGVPTGALPPAAQRVQEALRARGSAARVVTLERPGHTATEAAQVLDCDVARIVKSLVFRGAGSGQPLLVLASGANRVDESRLAALAGEPAGRATPEFVREHTGFAIGGVAPLGHPAALPTWIDQDLLQHPSVWAAGGTPEAFVRLDPHDLAGLTGGTVTAIR